VFDSDALFELAADPAEAVGFAEMATLPLDELMAADWAEALRPVDGQLRGVLTFLAAEVADELFLTHATLVTAEPDARRLFEGALRPPGTVRLERVSLHESPDGERYERSRLRYR